MYEKTLPIVIDCYLGNQCDLVIFESMSTRLRKKEIMIIYLFD